MTKEINLIELPICMNKYCNNPIIVEITFHKDLCFDCSRRLIKINKQDKLKQKILTHY